MLTALNSFSQYVGNVPLKRINFDGVNLYCKLEFYNHSGSIKDRAALNVIRRGIEDGSIKPNSTIVESSSGNFAIALGFICRRLGLKFIPVVDPNINKLTKDLLKIIAPNMIEVTKMDKTGGYLLTRIETIQELRKEHKNCYWTNQYENPHNYQAYYEGLGEEICKDFDQLDYVFAAVSSGGTITGLSQRLKEKFPKVKIIAVDLEGSVIFGHRPKRRYVSGLGSSKTPEVLKHALIDDVLMVTHEELVKGCHDLLGDTNIFGGGSSGAVYHALKSFFINQRFDHTPTALFLCPDKGNAYIDTIYDKDWLQKLNRETHVPYEPEFYEHAV